MPDATHVVCMGDAPILFAIAEERHGGVQAQCVLEVGEHLGHGREDVSDEGAEESDVGERGTHDGGQLFQQAVALLKAVAGHTEAALCEPVDGTHKEDDGEEHRQGGPHMFKHIFVPEGIQPPRDGHDEEKEARTRDVRNSAASPQDVLQMRQKMKTKNVKSDTRMCGNIIGVSLGMCARKKHPICGNSRFSFFSK